MNILLDENLDWRLGRELTGHMVASVPLIGWAGMKNGELLRRAEAQFDVLVTMDRGIYHQQNLSGMRLIIVALHAKNESPQGDQATDAHPPGGCCKQHNPGSITRCEQRPSLSAAAGRRISSCAALARPSASW